MNEKFLKNILKIPTCSGHEDFLVECIERWCKTVGIQCHKDGSGNLFLKKGSANKFYPCCTSHLDTVFHDQEKLVKEKKFLEVVKEGDKFLCKDTGIGTDCKSGVAICLWCMKTLPSCKCALYVKEETGCQGVKASDMKFFDDVAWILGLDSPEQNRASKTLTGTRLYSDDFFNKFIQPLCRNHGVTDFRYEPWTDLKWIRIATNLESLNIGNGGRNCHSKSEYAVISDTLEACATALDLLKNVPTDQQWKSDVKEEHPSYSWGGSSYSFGKKKKKNSQETNPDHDKYIQDYFNFNYDNPDDDLPDEDYDELAPMEHDDTDFATIDFSFDDEEQLLEFKKLVKENSLGIDVDDDGFTTASCYGALGELKEAYTVYYNIVWKTEFFDWDDMISTEDDTRDFWSNLEFDEYEDDEKEKEDDVIDFQTWIEQRKAQNRRDVLGDDKK